LKSIQYFSLSLLLTSSFYINSQNIDDEVNQLVANMTLDEKVGQMTQVERNALEHISDLATYNIGSLLSGGGSAPTPNSLNAWIDMYNEYQTASLQSSSEIPLIYGIDAVHGHSNVKGAVIVPHNIGLGATWNSSLVQKISEITASEVSATGIDWTFAPCIAVPQNERWGRTYEGFGETAEINQIMGIASVVGLQGNDLALDNTILACAKHFIGDGGTTDGIDQGNTEITEEVLRSLHMPAYVDAIEQGVGTIMATYNSWNGQKVHGYKYLLTDVLKTELGFEGFIISDWKGVDQVSGDYKEAIKLSINAGVDMVMVPDRYKTFISYTKELINEGQISMSRIDDAVKRILKQKILLGLFEQPFAATSSAEIDAFGSTEHRDIARQAVRESLVVLDAKNNVLPLKQDGQTIGLAGVLADDLGAQCGGWTIAWQGGNGDITEGTSILEGFNKITNTSEVIFNQNGDFEQEIDVAIVVIGEKTPYSEGGGDRSSLNIENQDIALLKKLKSQNIPTVALLISGRPMIIGEALQHSDAMIAAWYPGTEGDGIAEVLFGLFDPKGKLTHSWPNHMRQIPINFGDESQNPLYPYKHGLTQFPTTSNTNLLKVYASAINDDGNIIRVYFNDIITSNLSDNDDYNLYINGDLVNSIIKDHYIDQNNPSILEINLLSNIEQGDEVYLTIEDNVLLSGNKSVHNADNVFVYNGVKNVNGMSYRIEAESYYEMYGVQTEQCSDLGGGLNVGYIDYGDYMKYSIDVPSTGFYQLVSRIAGFQDGAIDITFNSKIINLPFSTTGGWQNWVNFYEKVYLEKGEHIMTVTANSTQFNINYFDLIFDKENHEIPGKIEAENFSYANGIQTEYCQDDGGENIGHIDFEDDAGYPISVSQSGYYNVKLRYASIHEGYFSLGFGDQTYYFPFNSTGGWQNWETNTIELFLDGGPSTMNISSASKELNINFFEFEFAGTFTTNYTSTLNQIIIYPNPTKKHLKIETPINLDPDGIIKIFDVSGKLTWSYKVKNIRLNKEYIIDLDMTKGNYIISLDINGREYIKSFVIE
jgi:beta-glucosidase